MSKDNKKYNGLYILSGNMKGRMKRLFAFCEVYGATEYEVIETELPSGKKKLALLVYFPNLKSRDAFARNHDIFYAARTFHADAEEWAQRIGGRNTGFLLRAKVKQ